MADPASSSSSSSRSNGNHQDEGAGGCGCQFHISDTTAKVALGALVTIGTGALAIVGHWMLKPSPQPALPPPPPPPRPQLLPPALLPPLPDLRPLPPAFPQLPPALAGPPPHAHERRIILAPRRREPLDPLAPQHAGVAAIEEQAAALAQTADQLAEQLENDEEDDIVSPPGGAFVEEVSDSDDERKEPLDPPERVSAALRSDSVGRSRIRRHRDGEERLDGRRIESPHSHSRRSKRHRAGYR